MKKSFIKAISYYLPDLILSNEDLVKEFPDWTAEKVANKIGVSIRHIVRSDETAVDMAIKAGEKLFKEHNILPSEVDFVILCTQSPDYFLPTSACLVQNALGIPTTSGAFDFNLGCSGFVYGLAIAKGLIIGNIAKNVLLITSETYSKYIHPKDKVNRTIFGDAASSTLISGSGYAEILEFSLGTDGSGADKLIVKSGALRNPDKSNELIFDESGNPVSPDYLFMDGSGIFNFTLEMVPILVKDTLATNELEMEQINQFIFHQANKYMLGFLRKKIQIPENKFYQEMSLTGNTVSSTIPIALYDAINNNLILKNELVLLAGFGVGFSWAGTVLKFDKYL